MFSTDSTNESSSCITAEILLKKIRLYIHKMPSCIQICSQHHMVEDPVRELISEFHINLNQATWTDADLLHITPKYIFFLLIIENNLECFSKKMCK